MPPSTLLAAVALLAGALVTAQAIVAGPALSESKDLP
jgi:hypothetical protein